MAPFYFFRFLVLSGCQNESSAWAVTQNFTNIFLCLNCEKAPAEAGALKGCVDNPVDLFASVPEVHQNVQQVIEVNAS